MLHNYGPGKVERAATQESASLTPVYVE